MKYFLSIIKEHLTSRFIFGHIYWCRRSTNLTNYCKFCCQIRRCFILDKSENDTKYCYWLYYNTNYNQHHERIFQDNDFFSKDLNKIYKKCEHFEYVYSHNQLINFFGIVSVRIFLNIKKNYFFVGRMKQGYMYNFFIFWSQKLFLLCY